MKARSFGFPFLLMIANYHDASPTFSIQVISRLLHLGVDSEELAWLGGEDESGAKC
jgi:hypothetical protein